MVALIAIYKAPEDRAAFDSHYKDIHSPLAAKMEGMRKMEIARVNKMLTPPNATIAEAPYLMCTMYFDDQAALDNSMRQPNSRAAAKDLMGFAGPLVSMITVDIEEVAV
jgi:uncharacterized protein (TIGR02118 family)